MKHVRSTKGIMVGIALALTTSAAMLIAESLTTAHDDDSEQQVVFMQDECELMEDPKDHFPDLIVERVLVKNDVSKAYISEINVALDDIDPSVEEIYLSILASRYGDEDINDRSDQDIAMDIMEMARLEAFVTVMREYIDDAQLAMKMFDSIMTKREMALEACLKGED